MVLAGTGPEGGEGIANLSQVLQQGQKQSPDEPRLFLFFDPSDTSQAAGRALLERQARRTADRDPASTQQTMGAQAKAIVDWGSGSASRSATRLQRIRQPVLVVNGKTDVMVPTVNSFVLFQHLPSATLVLYPDSGHGALFQYAGAFVQEVHRFLGE